jgi:hypothetical protein
MLFPVGHSKRVIHPQSPTQTNIFGLTVLCSHFLHFDLTDFVDEKKGLITETRYKISVKKAWEGTRNCPLVIWNSKVLGHSHTQSETLESCVSQA